MLRISDSSPANATHYLSIDKKKRQVTLTDPTAAVPSASTQDRSPMVAAPKMFAFDGLFTCDDPQADVCSSALSEVIPAVLEGSDGCLLTIGYPAAGNTYIPDVILSIIHNICFFFLYRTNENNVRIGIICG